MTESHEHQQQCCIPEHGDAEVDRVEAVPALAGGRVGGAAGAAGLSQDGGSRADEQNE